MARTGEERRNPRLCPDETDSPLDFHWLKAKRHGEDFDCLNAQASVTIRNVCCQIVKASSFSPTGVIEKSSEMSKITMKYTNASDTLARSRLHHLRNRIEHVDKIKVIRRHRLGIEKKITTTTTKKKERKLDWSISTWATRSWCRGGCGNKSSPTCEWRCEARPCRAASNDPKYVSPPRPDDGTASYSW